MVYSLRLKVGRKSNEGWNARMGVRGVTQFKQSAYRATDLVRRPLDGERELT